MTTVDTSRYTPRDIAISIQIELENMPEVPTRYAVNGIIAQRATVEFDLSSGLPEFKRCQLKGSVPLKSGGPSRNPQSDDYWAGSLKYNPMPEPIKQVVAYAQTLVLGMLK